MVCDHGWGSGWAWEFAGIGYGDGERDGHVSRMKCKNLWLVPLGRKGLGLELGLG